MHTLSATSEQQHPFVCIEGIDGTGKSTVAARVAALIGGRYYKTPSEPFQQFRAEIDARADAVSRYYFYLSAVCFASCEIGKIRKREPVVCDRYIFSTYAYHFVMEPQLRRCALPIPIQMPDVAVMLTVAEAERSRRIARRELLGEQRGMSWERNDGFLERVQSEFRQMKLKVVDTTDRDASDVAAEIVALLRASEKPSETAKENLIYECTHTT